MQGDSKSEVANSTNGTTPLHHLGTESRHAATRRIQVSLPEQSCSLFGHLVKRSYHQAVTNQPLPVFRSVVMAKVAMLRF